MSSLAGTAMPFRFLATSQSAENDRGVIHQLLTSLGVSSNTAHTVQVVLSGPLHVLVIVLLALLASKLVKRLSRRIVRSLRLVSPMVRSTPRGEDRARTLTGVVSSALRVGIWVIALLAIIDQLGLRLAPFVATATIVGAALGFGAQTLVKDFLSGLLILAEDQYGVGDNIVIESSNTTGTVESVNLRTTRIRALDGVVWYVPNGDIRAVGNNTESESQAIVDFVLPNGTDLVAAGAAAQDEARRMAAEADWRGAIIGQPTFAGVQTASDSGVTMRVFARTAPGDHFRVARALRLRILERMRREGLAWVAATAAAGSPRTPPGELPPGGAAGPSTGGGPGRPGGPTRPGAPSSGPGPSSPVPTPGTAADAQTADVPSAELDRTEAEPGGGPVRPVVSPSSPDPGMGPDGLLGPRRPTPRSSTTPPRRLSGPRWRRWRGPRWRRWRRRR
jgi:small conductance mechanosensitive channel